MKNYRTGFYLAVAANLLLAAMLVGAWFYARSARTGQSAESGRGTMPAAAESTPEVPAPSPDTPLVPLQLSPSGSNPSA